VGVGVHLGDLNARLMMRVVNFVCSAWIHMLICFEYLQEEKLEGQLICYLICSVR
jgi:hypothetical protein